MFKKTITYTDFNDQERTEDFFFHLSKAELIEMEVGEAGGFSETLKKMVAEKDAPLIMKTFKMLILKAYGIKSADGKHFDKSEEISRNFENTEAYSVLFTDLCTNAEAASDFINKLLPLTDAEKEEAKKKAAAMTTELPANT